VKQVDGRAAHMTDTTRHQSWQSTPLPDHAGSIPGLITRKKIKGLKLYSPQKKLTRLSFFEFHGFNDDEIMPVNLSERNYKIQFVVSKLV
jgi:uncharacterized protein (DUF2126 family)